MTAAVTPDQWDSARSTLIVHVVLIMRLRSIREDQARAPALDVRQNGEHLSPNATLCFHLDSFRGQSAR